MTGGQFTNDKTCSIDCFIIDIINGNLKDFNASLKQARMQHSMILVEEIGTILAVGGEDENGNHLDSCEQLKLFENQWKVMSSLNNKGKNISLCKFIRNPNLR